MNRLTVRSIIKTALQRIFRPPLSLARSANDVYIINRAYLRLLVITANSSSREALKRGPSKGFAFGRVCD